VGSLAIKLLSTADEVIE